MKTIPARYLFFSLAAFLAWAMFYAPVTAQDVRLDELFTVKGVNVDVTASSAAEARRRAIIEAERRGFLTLLTKLTQPEDRARLPEISHDERQMMISGIGVVSEKSSGRRYVASFDIRFEAELVSDFFATYGVPHVLDAGAGLMAFHAHRKGQKLSFWEKVTERDAARATIDWTNRLRQYGWPRGNLSERLSLTAEQVAALDTEAGLVLARNYSESAVLMISSTWLGPEGGLVYKAVLTGADIIFEDKISVISPLNGSLESAAIAKMYEDILSAVDRDWRSKLMVDVAQKGTVLFMVPALKLKDWEHVLNKVRTLSLVKSLEIKKLGIPFSFINVRYTGRRDQLYVALRESGLTVSVRSDGLMLGLPNTDTPTVNSEAQKTQNIN